MACLALPGSQLNGIQFDSKMGCNAPPQAGWAAERDELDRKWTSKDIKHFYSNCETENGKLDEIHYLHPIFAAKWSVVFVNTAQTLERVTNHFDKKGCAYTCIVENMDPESRDSIMQQLRSRGSGVLITTESLAPFFRFQVDFVINYELPTDPNNYPHRMGWFGSKGTAFNFVTVIDFFIMFDIRRLYSTEFLVCPSKTSLEITFTPSMADSSEEEPQFVGQAYNFKAFQSWFGGSQEGSYFDGPFPIDYNEPYEKFCESFKDMKLKGNLLSSIRKYGYDKPTAIQQKGILPLLEGLDVFEEARSEPGKTVAYCIGILQRLDYRLSRCQCIVIASSPDSVADIAFVMRELGGQVKVHALGAEGPLHKSIFKGVQVVVGVIDNVVKMLTKEWLLSHHVKMIVFDDLDQIYYYAGGKSSICQLFNHLPDSVQRCVFSETVTPYVLDFVFDCTWCPVHIIVKQDDECTPLESMKHYVLSVKKIKVKSSDLLKLFEQLDAATRSIVFVGDRAMVNVLADELQRSTTKFRVAVMCQKDGRQLNQKDRNSIIKEFQDGSVGVVITTSSLVAGLEFQAPLVINYDLPYDKEEYLGCVGRYGREGAASINFATKHDWFRFMTQDLGDIDFEQLPANFTGISHLVASTEESGQPTSKRLNTNSTFTATATKRPKIDSASSLAQIYHDQEVECVIESGV